MTRYNDTSYSGSSYGNFVESSENSSLLTSIKTTPSVKKITIENCMLPDRPKTILDIDKVNIPTNKPSGKDPSAEQFSLSDRHSIKDSVNALANNEQSLQTNSAPDTEKREAARNLFQSLQKNRGVSDQETSRILSELTA